MFDSFGACHKPPVLVLMLAVLLELTLPSLRCAGQRPRWKHVSSAEGQLPVPVAGQQQTASQVLDIDRDGTNDIVIAERTRAPSVVWLRRTAQGWRRYVIDDSRLHIEAGGAFHDIDRDGDPDLVFGGDAASNQLWWWENPYPDFRPSTPWKRRLIKSDGGTKHHDQLFGDFDGDGRAELVFWNQRAKRLCLAEIPSDPRRAARWPYQTIYRWEDGAEHEGLAMADIDGDGKLDIVGGGRWFQHRRGTKFVVRRVDDAMRFTRAAAGQLQEGGWAELVFVPGDADGKLRWYSWNGRKWVGHTLLDGVIHGHSLELGDVNRDGHLDIFLGEMGAWGRRGHNQQARTVIFYGDGKGGFRQVTVAKGYANHQSRLGDLDGDGDLDILQKPYSWKTPRLDIWLNLGSTPDDEPPARHEKGERRPSGP